MYENRTKTTFEQPLHSIQSQSHSKHNLKYLLVDINNNKQTNNNCRLTIFIIITHKILWRHTNMYRTTHDVFSLPWFRTSNHVFGWTLIHLLLCSFSTFYKHCSSSRRRSARLNIIKFPLLISFSFTRLAGWERCHFHKNVFYCIWKKI